MSIRRIAVIQSISYSKCGEMIDKAMNRDTDFIVLCGGIGECMKVVDIPKTIFGIVDLSDDIHIIKLMKSRNIYISGKWKQIGNDICIGGIDAKNPVQNLSMLLERPIYSCKNAILVSRYPILNSRCSSISILGKELLIGFEMDLMKRLLSYVEKLVFICCNKDLDRTCIDVIIGDRFVHLVLVEHFANLIIDFNDIRRLVIKS